MKVKCPDFISPPKVFSYEKKPHYLINFHSLYVIFCIIAFPTWETASDVFGTSEIAKFL